MHEEDSPTTLRSPETPQGGLGGRDVEPHQALLLAFMSPALSCSATRALAGEALS